jgi:ankyrin repeat protein
MRLLQIQSDSSFSLVNYDDKPTPPYAILSHTWGADDEEVTFDDLRKGTGKSKAGCHKLAFCSKQATSDGLRHFWIDTCCIDKSSSQELSEAINSMFRWYKNAERCYVYLSDVSDSPSNRDGECTRRWKPAFKKSRWFTRGWTLQELLAPASVEFFSKEGTCLGNKQSLEKTLHEITDISAKALRGCPLSQFSMEDRFSWSSRRKTRREEDEAYCLLGIFGICMPLLYSEGRESALNRLKEQINKHPKDRSSLLDDEHKRMLLDSLRFDQIDARQMTIKNAHAKTCKWLLKNPQYLEWLDDTKLREHHGFLWIKGKAGAGKSTLMKFAVINARKTMKDRITLSFFFNARGENIEKSTIGTYRSLLLQLLERIPALQCVLDSLSILRSSFSADHQWTIELLKTLLEQAIQALGESSVMCFIDALDECEEEHVRDMVRFFEHVSELAMSNQIHFQVCFSSRHYPHITIRKGLELVLEGQEGHAQDITNYVETELKIGKSKTSQQIRVELQDKSSGIFMWVVLVVDILNKESDRGQVHTLRRKLREIPGDLHALFRDILTRDSHNKGALVLCIQWVLFSKQPLSPEQLYHAILWGIDPDAVLEWDSEITKDVIKRFILDSSKGLAEVTMSQEQKVQFIHESVRDFLLKESGLGNIWPEYESNFQGQSNERLKQCCLTYIRRDIFTTLDISGDLLRATSPSDAANLRDLESLPFLEYAVQNVLYHANMAEGSGILQDSFIQSFPLDCWIKLDNFFEKRIIRKHTENMSMLYVLAERNMSNLTKAFPSALPWLEVGKERYGPPLFAAMSSGSDKVVQECLKTLSKGPHMASHSQEVYASYCKNKGRQEVFRHAFKFSKKRGILSYLAESGHEAVVKLLVETGQADVDSKDYKGRTPLSWAAGNGHEATVKLLVKTGQADVDSKDNNGRTPLWWAARNGHEATVKLLVGTGQADVDSKDKNFGQTPLSWAAENGHEAIAKLLVETGQADVDSKDNNGRTPLSWAARNGHEAIAKLLVETGQADVDSKDKNFGQTPLSWAARNGQEAIAKLLVETGQADVDSKDKDFGQTPLSWAARNGHEAIAKLLVETGQADVDSKDNKGRTPLSWAAENGNEATVKLLVETGQADVDSKDNNGRTPLSWAARNGHEATVKLLVETGQADVDSKDKNFGQTPLSWAAENGHEATVKLLQAFHPM